MADDVETAAAADAAAVVVAHACQVECSEVAKSELVFAGQVTNLFAHEASLWVWKL